MKTQISNLVNGSEFTIRDLSAEKYKDNPIGHFNSKPNVPQYGGTPSEERMAIADNVGQENPEKLHILVKGIELTLDRHNSTTGKSWCWDADITADQLSAIIGKAAPAWTHKGAVNTYGISVSDNCCVSLWASSGKKACNYILGEEFIMIL